MQWSFSVTFVSTYSVSLGSRLLSHSPSTLFSHSSLHDPRDRGPHRKKTRRTSYRTTGRVEVTYFGRLVSSEEQWGCLKGVPLLGVLPSDRTSVLAEWNFDGTVPVYIRIVLPSPRVLPVVSNYFSPDWRGLVGGRNGDGGHPRVRVGMVISFPVSWHVIEYSPLRFEGRTVWGRESYLINVMLSILLFDNIIKIWRICE